MRISRGKSDSLVKFNYKIDGMRGLILAVTHRIKNKNKFPYADPKFTEPFTYSYRENLEDIKVTNR